MNPVMWSGADLWLDSVAAQGNAASQEIEHTSVSVQRTQEKTRK
jgi:hypothetical protein